MILALMFASLASAQSWETGVSFLRKQALESSVEFSAFYFFAGGRGEWTEFLPGQELGTRPDFQGAGQVLKRFVSRRPKSLRLCALHTHPLRANLALAKMDKQTLRDRYLSGLENLPEIPSSPPGQADISLELGGDELAAGVALHKATAALDSLGVWYFSLRPEEESQEHFFQRMGFAPAAVAPYESLDINQTRTPFMIQVASQKIPAEKISLLPSYRLLQLAYAAQDAAIRFVPYSQVGKELPCAGL